MSFKYQPLDPMKLEIRLLTILPHREFESQIICTLRTVSLKQHPQFEALSYVWGGLEATENIVLDGNSFQITPSLVSALRYLRLADQPRVIWADYICINQADVEEKSTQLLMMWAIYCICTRVVCFLGGPSPRIEAVITWIERYVQKKVTKRTLPWWKHDGKALFSVNARLKKDIASLAAYKGMNDLIHLPYWTRMWTYQEFNLAKYEPICVCGRFNFNASVLSLAVQDRLVAVARTLVARLGDVQEVGYEEFAELLEQLESYDPGCFMTHVDGRKGVRTKNRKGLTSLLWLTARHHCSDPRDKIYALYGMASAAQDAYPADYTKPVEQVMKEATTYIITKEVGLTIFSVFFCRVDNVTNCLLPSWVPEYSENAIDSVDRMAEKGRATQGIEIGKWAIQRADKARPYVSTDLSTLHFLAASVGNCQVLFKFGSDIRAVAVQMTQFLETIPKPLTTIWEEATVLERLMQAIFCHGMPNVNLLAENVVTIIRALSAGATSTRGCRHGCWDDELWDKVSDALGEACHKTMFLVNNERVCGFGVSGVAVSNDDEVFLANKAPNPLVLRRKQDQNNDGSGLRYQLVGQAFIDGLARCQTPNLFCDYVQKQPFKEILVV
ncbi:heterokaryon incompatibility protein-domain-containing protein [Aspergillus cavernicola]|uniref:Heterokaryon incompatibility protein-domain-containing protein n=1 Tax=Aspergillus cavernicola TaxID=176166 RepID=A0ABR4IJL5_9EURO